MANPGTISGIALTSHKGLLLAALFMMLLSTSGLTAQNRPSSDDAASKAQPSAQPAEQPAPAADQTLATPSTPEQMPARPPRVSGGNGTLTIVAENSTLSDVLDSIREKTGAQIDIPEGAGDERVVVHLGPGPARDVLSALFYGMPFNYVIEGSDTDPLEVRAVVLTKRTSAATTVAARSTYSPPAARTAYVPTPEPVSAANDNSMGTQATVSEPPVGPNAERPAVAESAQPANAMTSAPALPVEASAVPPPPPAGDTDANGKPTRPIDQMSNMMFRMYQQRQQLQEQQNQQQQQQQPKPSQP